MFCEYCPGEVFIDEPGWGYALDKVNSVVMYFHLECLEFAEDVAIA